MKDRMAAHPPRMWAVLALALGLSLNAVAVTVWQFTHQPWAPLGDYPVQRVITRDRTPRGEPIVHEGDFVQTDAVKCNDTTENVTVDGRMLWVAVEPPGASIKVSEGVAVRNPGCQRFQFVNEVPDEVFTRMRRLGQTEATWAIRGTETPIDGKRKGATVGWTTVNIIVRLSDHQGDTQ